jgi:hypothetical protein
MIILPSLVISSPIANCRGADLLEVVRHQPDHHVAVDPVAFALAEVETAKPLADIHGRAPHALSG